MWKTIGVSVLRCGAIYSVFGVLGIFYYAYRWSRSATPEPILLTVEPCGEDPTA